MLFKVFKNIKCPNGVRACIASFLELKQLLYFTNIKIYRDLFEEAFLAKVDEIAEHTIKELTPIMLNARKVARQDLQNQLNPELYEKNFGQALRENIKKVIKAGELQLFVRYSKASASGTKGSEGTASVD